MTGYIANTDGAWFDFLRSQPAQAEVNFWSPSAHSVFRGPIGSPFFFKLKSPDNAISGYGVVAWADRMPEWLAWECFGQGNGAPNLVAVQTQIERLRKSSDIQGRDSLDQIGCVILSRPAFFPPERWIPQPSDWKKNNLRYAGYDLARGEGARVWRECQVRIEGLDMQGAADRYGQPVLVAPRLGQGTFRLAVTKAYSGSCAMTGEHSLPALEAAHIKPYAGDGEHEVSNGILLRSDLHRLFDCGYMTVTPEHRIEVSRQLKEHFSNGKSYNPLQGAALSLPAAKTTCRMLRSFSGTTSTYSEHDAHRPKGVVYRCGERLCEFCGCDATVGLAVGEFTTAVPPRGGRGGTGGADGT